MDAKEFKEAFDPSVQFIATDQITGIYTFLHALDWTEAWPYLCIALHITLFITITLLRHHSTAQGVIFLGMLLAVYMAEYINEFLSRHHRVFTKHQYFDSYGLFISIVVSLPMLVNCTAILVFQFCSVPCKSRPKARPRFSDKLVMVISAIAQGAPSTASVVGGGKKKR